MGVFILIIIGLFIYFIPTIVGWKTKHVDGIILLNLFMGWTILGWLGALIWAVSSPSKNGEYIYKCPKCGYKSTLDQKVRIYVCSQCRTETAYE